MFQTFIRAGSRQLVVLTCAAVAIASVASADTVAVLDVLSSPESTGIDTAPVEPGRRATAKRDAATRLYDSGPVNPANGFASEYSPGLGVEIRTADDFDVNNAIWGITHLNYRPLMQRTPVFPSLARLEMFSSADQCSAPVGPANSSPRRPYASNPPFYVSTTTDRIDTGQTLFGRGVYDYQFLTPGLNLTCGKYWACPMQAGRNSSNQQPFVCMSNQPHSLGSISHLRAPVFGFADWVPWNTVGFDFDLFLQVNGNRTGAKNCCAVGGGTCDLAPIEAKLDDETRFTDDSELASLQRIIESRASQASVDALEAKADAMQLSLDQLQNTLCDIVRLLHTPNGQRRATCNGVDYEWNGLQGGGGD